MPSKSKITIAFVIVAAFFAIVFGQRIGEVNDATTIQIKQAWITGKMSVYTDPGYIWQNLGKLDELPKSMPFYFSSETDEGDNTDQSIAVSFNNGSKGTVSGSVWYTYPLTKDELIAIYKKFGSDVGVRTGLVQKQMRKLVNLTASLMSPEAAMVQKELFNQMLNDQVQNGPYMTEIVEVITVDSITKEETTTETVKIKEVDGVKLRGENPFDDWSVEITQVDVPTITTDGTTELMIEERRNAEMQIMVAKAQVETANQNELKIIAEGKASVAEKEYEALQVKMTATVKAQELKEVAVINAEMAKEVNEERLEAALIDKKTAAAEKEATLLRKSGEAEGMKMIMEADGALGVKTAAWTESQIAWAEASKSWPAMVPTIVNGGSGDGDGDATTAMSMLEIIGTKAALDLALDMNMDVTK